MLKYLFIKLLPKQVTLDGTDGTVTISKYLYKAFIWLGIRKCNRIYAFRIKDTYGFAINPPQLKDVDTHFYELQYNDRYRTIGFCPTCPTVAMMLNDLGLPYDCTKKLDITTHLAKSLIYFRIKK